MMEKADKPMHHIKEIVKGAKYILKTLEDRKMVELE